MSLLEMSAEMPNTEGLPVYEITKIIKQRVGSKIHFLCGNEAFGRVHWFYIATMDAGDVIEHSRESERLALGAVIESVGLVASKAH